MLSTTSLPRLALWSIVGVATAQMAASGLFGDRARRGVQELTSYFKRSSASGALPSSGVPRMVQPSPSAGWQPLALFDLGGFPVEWRNGTVRQRRDLGGTNTYSAGDVFQFADGSLVQFQGGDQFVTLADGWAVGVGVH
jgi:hypothetical protein